MNCNHCLFYVAGLLTAFAYDNISFKKVATQSHTLNAEASYAVDGSISTCMRTLDIGRTSPYKTVWWIVDLGEVYSIYSIYILFKTYDGYVERQMGRFAGFSLYLSNADVSTAADIKASTLCYKDGPQLPPLNFTTVCTESARYVIFYNERLDGVVYPTGYIIVNVVTELCEVIVQGCSTAGFYGRNCDTPCPTNCEDSMCHIQSGTCFNCEPGWTGIYCSTTCDDGTYGYHCVNNCSGHCLNGYPCNKHTGHCDRGCNPGYTNGDCSKRCPPGYFGMDCTNHCIGYCLNNEPCNHVSGVCLSGCRNGYVGTHCNNACKNGYFGENCSRVCSPNCKPDTCRHTDGSCTTCDAGYTGYNCTTECMMSYGENCRYTCSVHCINQTCDRINGSCLYDCRDRERCDIDTAIYMIYSSSNHLPLLVGGIVGVVACLITIIGVVVTISVIRKKSLCKKCHFNDLHFCWMSTSVAEQRANTEDASNYQELNFPLEENPYQRISR